MEKEKDKTSYKVKDGLKYVYCHDCGSKKEAININSRCVKCQRKRNISLLKHLDGKKDTPLFPVEIKKNTSQ